MKKIIGFIILLFLVQNVFALLSDSELDKLNKNLPEICGGLDIKSIYKQSCNANSFAGQASHTIVCDDGPHQVSITACNTILIDGQEITGNLVRNETKIEKTYFFENLFGITIFGISIIDISLIATTVIGISIVIKFKKKIINYFISSKIYKNLFLKIVPKKPKSPE